MSHKSFLGRVKFLAKHPALGIRKILPYLFSLVLRVRRAAYERLGIYRYSVPYNGTELLLKYLNLEKGFFVECGGNDGYHQDPTYYLEKCKKWTGIIVEPLDVYKDCQKNRSRSVVYNCALVPRTYSEDSVTIIDCNAMSIIKNGVDDYEDWVKNGEKLQGIISEELVVPARTLDSLLEEYFVDHTRRPIDLLVIDVEGYELEVIKGFDISKYRPAFLLIEVLDQKRLEYLEALIGPTYKFLTKISFNDYLFKLDELSALDLS